ncbi:MAG: SprT family zinc-dependent metalloprotease [Pseudomonadota bacterium]
MTHYELAGTPPIRVHLRRSARARRMSLRVSRLDGKVTLTLPRRAPMRAALSFIEERAPWIRGHLDRLDPLVPVGLGTVLPVQGQALRVVSGPRTEVRMASGELAVSARATSAGAAAAGALKALARDRLSIASDHFAARLGRTYARITLRDTRSRWGSCTDEGALMYSWRLVMAPPDVLDYVAAHEVAHLAEMNHSARFWETVERLYPGFQPQRLWLRERGQDLHRYRFAGVQSGPAD